MSETVKIVQFHEIGGPEVLRLESLPLPEPGPGEVRLRVRAIGLNRAEIMYRTGGYYLAPVFPSHNGYEAAGLVEAVGPGVEPDLVGKTRSTVPNFPLNRYGVYGEVAIVPATSLAAYPGHLSFEQGTSIWMQYITAYGALIHNGRLATGDHVLITAASSSVGLAAIQITRAEGGISIATTRTAAKKPALLAAGADHVIVTDEENLRERILQITGGAGAKIVFDAVAGPGIADLAMATAKDGLIVIYGLLSPQPTPFPIFESWTQASMLKPFKLMGYALHEITGEPGALGRAIAYVYEKIDSGQLKPRIDRTFRLDEIAEAHRYLEKNQHIGKVVVTV